MTATGQRKDRWYKICSLLAMCSLIFAITASNQVAAGVVPGAVHIWDASVDTDGDSVWEDTGSPASHDWSLMGSEGANVNGPARVAVNSATRISHAYDFDGTDDSGSAASENRSGNHDATFELWFKPVTFPTAAPRTIFEHGNTLRGISFGLNGDDLVFAYGAGGDTPPLTFDLDTDDDGIDYADFIQVFGVVDDTNDQLRMYVNGGNEQLQSIGTGSDFTSKDVWGLARNEGKGGGGQEGTGLTWEGSYTGQIAILREYRSAFGLAEVQQNFDAMTIPEPSSGIILLLGALALSTMRSSLCVARRQSLLL